MKTAYEVVAQLPPKHRVVKHHGIVEADGKQFIADYWVILGPLDPNREDLEDFTQPEVSGHYLSRGAIDAAIAKDTWRNRRIASSFPQEEERYHGMTLDRIYDLCDDILAAMEANPDRDWTASPLAQKLKANTHEVGIALGWMVENKYLVASGNGAWTHYSLDPYKLKLLQEQRAGTYAPRTAAVTQTYKVPQRFYDDHLSRKDDYDNESAPPRRSGVYYVVELDQAAYDDLYSDADYYATMPPGEMDSSYNGLIQSARATVRALKSQKTAAVEIPANYKKDYNRGWKASSGGSGNSEYSPLERADMRGESSAWYDGYMDYAVDRPKWASLEALQQGLTIDEWIEANP